MKWRNVYVDLMILYLVFLGLSFVVQGPEDSSSVEAILAVSTFMFAIYLAFTISRRHARLEHLQSMFRQNDAILLDLYRYSGQFGKAAKKRMLKKIDAFLMAQIDYKMEDYHLSMPELLAVQDEVLTLKAKTNVQIESFDQMITHTSALTLNLKETSYTVKDKMLPYEWGALITLTFIVWVSLLFLGDQSFFISLVMPMLATCFGLLLIIVRDLNNLTWQEHQWVWKPLEELFRELDLLPYVSEPLIKDGWVPENELLEMKSYRLATYPNPYPDMKGKKVKVVKNKLT